MPTDTERREVARRLRELAEPIRNWSYRELMGAIGAKWSASTPRTRNKHNMLVRLADLIEPIEPKVKCVAEVKVDGEQLEKPVHDAAVELTGIDRDALLALADEMMDVSIGISSADGIRPLEAAYIVQGYARRIRGALGVSDD